MANTRAETHRQSYAEHSARRRLLLKTLGLGAAGLAAGGAAAWAKGELAKPVVSGPTLADLQAQLERDNAARAALALSYSALQTQANQWQTELASASSQNAQLAGAVTAAQQEAAALKAQLAEAQAALEAATQRVAHGNDLLGLYSQLDGIGLDAVVANGMGVVSGALASVAGPAALLRAGLDAAHNMLVAFEQVLPDFNGAMAWLGEQVVKLKVGLWSVESSAQESTNSAISGLTAAFGGFAGFVLDHLPFNIGAKVRATLGTVQTVLGNLTEMTDAAPDKVLLKISKHVDDGPQSWKNTLVTPLREQTLAPADQVLAALNGAGNAFTTSLKDPATAAIAQREALRQQIAAYRAANNI
jgi:hypothetical protein